MLVTVIIIGLIYYVFIFLNIFSLFSLYKINHQDNLLEFYLSTEKVIFPGLMTSIIVCDILSIVGIPFS